MPEEKDQSKTKTKSVPGLGVFLVGLFGLNLILILSIFVEISKLHILIFSILLSLLLALFLYYQRKKFVREFRAPKKESGETIPETTVGDPPAMEQEPEAEDIQKTKNQLQKITGEFEDATHKLFAREMELKDANKRLREVDTVKSDFVSTAAHQLRTPLTGIKWSYTALLETDTGLLNETQKGIVEKGLETIDYAISVINDLLNTARLEEGKTGFNFTEQPIGPIIQEILDQHKETIKEKKIKLVVDMPLTSSFSFRFDRERIAIVFDNFLANAIKYTPPGGAIHLKSFRTEKEIQFKITDTGIGIPSNDLDKVFSKFFRAKNAIGFETSGSGLGLYVAKNIVERHGGSITLESEENKGTTFTITLPLPNNHG